MQEMAEFHAKAGKPLADYRRISSKPQERGHSLSAQTKNISRRRQALNLPPADPKYTYTDIESGTKDDRAALSLMIAAIEAGEIGGFICHLPDRFFRDLYKSLGMHERLKRAGAQVIFADDPYDIFSMEGEQRFKRDMLQADEFSRVLSKHLSKGKRQNFDEGRSNAPRPRWGIASRDRETGIETYDPHKHALIRQMHELYMTGNHTDSSIAKALGLSYTVVRNALINPEHAGKVVRRKRKFRSNSWRDTTLELNDSINAERCPLTWPEFEALQAMRASKKSGGRGAHTTKRHTHDYALSGLGVCSHCGSKLNAFYRVRTQTREYACGAARRGASCICGTRAMHEDDIAAQIMHALHQAGVQADITQAVEAVAITAGKPDAVADHKRIVDSMKRDAMQQRMSNRISDEEFLRLMAKAESEANKPIKPVKTDTRQIRKALEVMRDLFTLYIDLNGHERRVTLSQMITSYSADMMTKRVVSITAREIAATALRQLSCVREVGVGVFELIY